MKVRVPHPVNYGFHKLIISSRRINEDKIQKDIDAGLSVLKLYVEKEGKDILREVYQNISNKHKKNIIQLIKDEKEYILLEILN